MTGDPPAARTGRSRGEGKRGRCAICETYVAVYPAPRYGAIYPRAHSHPWRKTDTGWPALCDGVNYPVTDLASTS